MKKYFYTGSYSSADEEGIALYSLDTASGAMAKERGFCGVENPSYLVINTAGTRLYALSECDGKGSVHAFSIDENRSLVPINSAETEGGWLCHIALSPNEKFVAVAGYQVGTVDVFALDDNGGIAKRVFSDRHEGKGAVPERQDCPHAHNVFFPSRYPGEFLVTDLGTDEIYRYRYDENTGETAQIGKFALEAGDGPRHIAENAEDNSILYLVCEIAFKLYTLRITDDGFEILDVCETMPEYPPELFGGASALRFHGGKMYVGNRVITPDAGLDCIAYYKIANDGKPTSPTFTKTDCKMPRDFNFGGGYIVIGSQTENKLICRRMGDNGEIGEVTSTLDAKAISFVSEIK